LGVEATMLIRPFMPEDEPAVIALWQQCGLTRPWNDPRKDIARKLKVDPELFVVAVENGELVASAMGGYEGHRGWVNYLAVRPDLRRRGIGRKLMLRLEGDLKARGCPKINLQIRTSNAAAVGFYRALGYDVDEVVSMGKRLERDD
jgi:ribosomal protein S18 acetylase RimI-like enzyme